MIGVLSTVRHQQWKGSTFYATFAKNNSEREEPSTTRWILDSLSTLFKEIWRHKNFCILCEIHGYPQILPKLLGKVSAI
jgi:hypothetical protein